MCAKRGSAKGRRPSPPYEAPPEPQPLNASPYEASPEPQPLNASSDEASPELQPLNASEGPRPRRGRSGERRAAQTVAFVAADTPGPVSGTIEHPMPSRHPSELPALPAVIVSSRFIVDDPPLVDPPPLTTIVPSLAAPAPLDTITQSPISRPTPKPRPSSVPIWLAAIIVVMAAIAFSLLNDRRPTELAEREQPTAPSATSTLEFEPELITTTPTSEPELTEPTPEPKLAEPKLAEPTPEPKLAEPTPEPKLAAPAPEPKLTAPTPEPELAASTPEPKLAPAPEPELVAPTPEPMLTSTLAARVPRIRAPRPERPTLEDPARRYDDIPPKAAATRPHVPQRREANPTQAAAEPRHNHHTSAPLTGNPRIYLQTDPAGAEVWLLGRLRGKSPMSLDLDGPVEVTLTHPERQTTRITLAPANGSRWLSVPLAPR